MESEWPLMVDRQLRVGLSECAALAILRGGAEIQGVHAPYVFGTDNAVILREEDPRLPPAAYTNYMRHRAAQRCYSPGVCYTAPYETVAPKFVPKYLLAFKGGKLSECRSVDFAKVDAKVSNDELFSLPCLKDVPGFEKR